MSCYSSICEANKKHMEDYEKNLKSLVINSIKISEKTLIKIVMKNIFLKLIFSILKIFITLRMINIFA